MTVRVPPSSTAVTWAVVLGLVLAIPAVARSQQDFVLRSQLQAYPLPPVADVLVINATWTEDPLPPFAFSGAQIDTAMQALSDYVLENSYGDVALTWTVQPVRLPHPKSTYAAGGPLYGQMFLDAFDELPWYVDPSEYLFHVIVSDVKTQGGVLGGGNGFPGGTLGVSDLSTYLVAHEFIHALNVPHAKGRTLPCSATGTCVPGGPAPLWNPVVEEEHVKRSPLDIMGASKGWGADAHANVRVKQYAGWLDPAFITTLDPNEPGVTGTTHTIVLRQHDDGTPPQAGDTLGIRIPRDDTWDYWIEFRRRLTGDMGGCTAFPTNAAEGVLVLLGSQGWRYNGQKDVSTSPGPDPFGFEMLDLLDMNPGSQVFYSCEEAVSELGDAALEPGQGAFEDFPTGIRIDLVSLDTASSPATATVDITIPSGHTAPTPDAPTTTRFLSPASTLPTYTSPSGATFEVHASDADGVQDVVFEVYAPGDEDPSLELPGQQGGAPGTWTVTVDPATAGMPWPWARGGYTVVARVEDGLGRFDALGRYVLVDVP